MRGEPLGHSDSGLVQGAEVVTSPPQLGVDICPWCPQSAYTVVPMKLPAWEGSDVGAMQEDGW